MSCETPRAHIIKPPPPKQKRQTTGRYDPGEKACSRSTASAPAALYEWCTEYIHSTQQPRASLVDSQLPHDHKDWKGKGGWGQGGMGARTSPCRPQSTLFRLSVPACRRASHPTYASPLNPPGQRACKPLAILPVLQQRSNMPQARMRDLPGSVRSATRGDVTPPRPLDKRKMQHGCVTQILAHGVACEMLGRGERSASSTPTVICTAVRHGQNTCTRVRCDVY